MITASSRLPLTAKHCDARKEAAAYISREERQTIIRPLILELSVNLSYLAAILKASPTDPAQSSDDLAALAWIQRTLEDVKATIIGLSEVKRRHSATF
ncbi:hypothetical protein AB4Y95_02220 [Arthrobacter sp. M-10]|uniref:hypothetical protein n=1 Tax=Arthrobacter sp. M-10 TaxID=3233037 RepID=UPI003F9336C1